MKLKIFAISLIMLLFATFAFADPINPFTYLQSTYTYAAAVPNPNTAYGTIEGADGFNDGNDFAVLWSKGNVGFFTEGSSTAYKVISTLGTSGITEVPNGIYGGNIAVSDNEDIYIYDSSGSRVKTIDVVSDDILDLTYDAQRDRLIVTTVSNIATVSDDGSIEELLDVGHYTGIEVLDMENNPLTDDMFQADGSFKIMNSGGDITGSAYITNLDQGQSLTGIAYTNNYAMMALGAGWYLYTKLPHQDHLETNPYTTEITLIAPENDHVETESNTLTFEYSITSVSEVASCDLLINGEGLQTTETPTTDTTLEFIQELGNGEFEWTVSCTNGIGEANESRYLTVMCEYDPEDPLPLVPSEPNIMEIIPHPHPEWDANMVSIEEVSEGNEVAVLYADGRITVHDANFSTELDLIDTNIPAVTGLTKLPAGYYAGAWAAVSDANAIYLLDPNGRTLDFTDVNTPTPIEELKWDDAFARMLVGTDIGISVLDCNGMTLLKSGSSAVVKPINMDPNYYDMFVQDVNFFVFDPNGDWDSNVPGKTTGYAQGNGMAITKTNLYISQPDRIIKYHPADFQAFVIHALAPLEGRLRADLDADGTIDSGDLLIMFDDWLAGPDSVADIHKDDKATVDFADFCILADEWLKTEYCHFF